MSAKRVTVVAASLLLAHAPRTASAYCLEGELGTPTPNYAEVFLYVDGSTVMGHAIGNVEHEIMLAVDTWNEGSDAHFRLHYAGVTNDPDPNDRIVIRGDNVLNGIECSSSNTACEETFYTLPPYSYRAGSTVWIIFDPVNPPRLDTIHRHVVHEIGHSLGLEDTSPLVNDVCEHGIYDAGGVMGYGILNYAASIGRDDQEGLQALYGPRPTIPSAFSSSTDRINWTSQQLDPTPQAFKYPLGSASNGLAREHLAYAMDDEPIREVDTCHLASCLGVDVLELPPFSTTRNMVSLASKSANESLIVYPSGETVLDGMRTIRWSLTNDNWASLDASGQLEEDADNILIPFHGVSATYDKRSERYVLAFRETFGREIVVVTILEAAPYTMSAVSRSRWPSPRTPAIECTGPEYAGSATETCLLVWLADEAKHPIAYAPVSIDPETGDAEFGTMGLTQITGYSTPSLTETQDEDVPWMMALRQEDDFQVFTADVSLAWSSGITAVPNNVLPAGNAPSISMTNDGTTRTLRVRYGLGNYTPP